jgi:hypothetical protein
MYTPTSFEYDALIRAHDMSLKVLLRVIAVVCGFSLFTRADIDL